MGTHKTAPAQGVTASDKERARALFRANAQRPPASLRSRLEERLQLRQREAILRAAEFAAGQRVMDIGAGLGYLATAAKDEGAHVVALDIVPEAVERLKDTVDEVIVADVESYESDRTYDRILFIGVLDFVVDPQRALTKVCGMLAPGGRLLVLVPTPSVTGRLYQAEKRLHGLRVSLFRPEWCRQVAEAAGLQTLSVERPQRNNALLVFTRKAASGVGALDREVA